MSLVLSIDLGTSGCRSAVYDETLCMIGCAKTDCPLIVRSDTEIEQSADAWWNAVDKTARDALAQCDARSVRAIGISSQGISIVPVDDRGRALHNAISWLDSRAEAELGALVAQYGEEHLFRRTGLIPGPLYSASKLAWMKTHLAGVMKKTRKLLMPMDLILLRLCGLYATDHTMACGTMLYNIAARRWDDELLGHIGIDRDLLPDIHGAGDALGSILPQVAKRWGVPEDVRVAVGAQDQKCAAHGAGVSDRIATASLGTASCISRLVRTPSVDIKRKIPCFAFVLDDFWDLEGIVNTAGSALGWFRGVFAPGLSFAELDGLARAVDGPSGVTFYPYLAKSASPYWAEGAGTFTGLTLGSGIGHCAKAVLEGVAYHIRENIEAMDGMGSETAELRLFGGGAASDVWCRIIADVVDRPVARMKSSDTALAGAANLAFKCLGIMPPPMEAGQVFEPEPQAAARYEQAFQAYEAFREKCYG